ncbi:MAG TPA: DUF3000 family protein [Mycobacteriales bacterium]|jgi:hypothetical protein|nr:DUF3000 family protein [Mycobacteriales bacterium]
MADVTGAGGRGTTALAGRITPPEPEPAPAAFRAAVDSIASAVLPDAVMVRDSPAPHRIAPFAAAWSVELGEEATGRLVYLHDPAGQPAWSGRDRLVAFTRVEVDAAMANDPLLADVVWEWFAEGLAAYGAQCTALGGTVTTTTSRRYGSLVHVSATHEAELRCSWTPVLAEGAAGPDLGAHLSGLVAAVAAMCGLPPSAGVRRLPG